MVRIAYCEDEEAQALLVKNMIDKWASSKNIECNISLFESAEELLFKNDTYPYDIIFLDIAMKEMNGIDLARKIREKDKQVKIAFLTADKQFALEGYEVKAVNYLVKPVSDEKLYTILNEVLEDLEATTEVNAFIMIEVSGNKQRIPVDRITYIEVQGHYIHIHISDGDCIKIKESFNGILERIQSQKNVMVQCHRSYAVNITYVEKIGRTECVLSDGSVLPVSRNSYKELNDRFIKTYADFM